MASGKNTLVLHRDDPEKDPLVGNIKVTRQDWLNVAMDVLIREGVEQVKVLTLGERLGVSRSSFYWYFKSRQDLLNALLDEWERTNTASLIARANAPADTITEAVCNVFHCVVDTEIFNTPLDFAVRAWARGSGKVRRVLDRSNAARLLALKDMFLRFGYEELEAETRARILYFTQIGYDDAELHESIEERNKLVPMYILGFTGKHALPEEIESFQLYAQSFSGKKRSE